MHSTAYHETIRFFAIFRCILSGQHKSAALRIVKPEQTELTEHVRCPQDGRHSEADAEPDDAPRHEVLCKCSSNTEEAFDEQVDEKGGSSAYAASTRGRGTVDCGY